MDDAGAAVSSCCHGPSACVFTKALMARSASCELATRHALGETDAMTCGSPVAQTNCTTLSALLRERAGFVLRLPRPPSPLPHVKALQLQCGGLIAMQHILEAPDDDVHRMIGLAHERHGSLLDLPWRAMVDAIAAWQPRRRRPQPGPGA